MKRITMMVLATAALVRPVAAMTNVYTGQLVAGPVASTTTYPLDLKSQGIDYISEEAVYSSATIAAAAFTDGNKSTATITILSTSSLVALQSSTTITVSTNNALAPTFGSDSILVSSAGTYLNGSTITVVTSSSYTLVGGVQFSSTVTTTTGTAVVIANAINANVENVTATVAGSSVIVTCNQAGVFCNSYIMNTSSPVFLSVASANFTGGNNNSSFNLNGTILTQGQQWTAQSLSSNTAISIMNSVNAVPGFTASTQTTTSVLIQCTASGTLCNTYTLTASTAALTVSTTPFTGGQNNAFLEINGVVLTQGNQWTVIGSTVQVSTSIVNAINTNAALSGIIVATATTSSFSSASGVIYATSTSQGVNAWSIYSSTAALSLSSNTFLNGSATAISTATSMINVPSHGMPTSLAVLFTGVGSSTAPVPLGFNTTYYIIDPIPTGSSTPDPNNLQLATTSTGAVAGSTISITSQTGGGSFKLTPLALNSSLGIQWQESNDLVNWVNIPSISSVTFSSATATSTTFWDFGNLDARQIRVSVNKSGDGIGAYNVTVTGNGKAAK